MLISSRVQLEYTVHRQKKEEDIDVDPRCSDVDFTPLKRAEEPAKLKSIIISPEPGVDTEEPHLPIQDALPQTEIEETLLEFPLITLVVAVSSSSGRVTLMSLC
ncbi:hypothetical protein F2Q69_00004391 [Brassica cretica]|uniref:Uncharacterized protein n=1 Tax=Brassica cretica TaxID=69181 RepID=A0A8S9NZW0_BRACR|nr:hypothetical protein F2Q69_00004391 [Brassica cretica]